MAPPCVRPLALCGLQQLLHLVWVRSLFVYGTCSTPEVYSFVCRGAVASSEFVMRATSCLFALFVGCSTGL